jgi:hypothetical protein
MNRHNASQIDCPALGRDRGLQSTMNKKEQYRYTASSTVAFHAVLFSMQSIDSLNADEADIAKIINANHELQALK